MWDNSLGYHYRCEKTTTSIRSRQSRVFDFMQSISDGGVEISPMLILNGALILKKWVQENNLDGDIL